MRKNKKWIMNLTNVDAGIFRTMNGNADELIAIGRIIKAGFLCSHVNITNAKYDAVVDLGGKHKLLRVQIKGSSNGMLNLMGGIRSGKQINRLSPSREYKYSNQECDLIIGIDSTNGDCYILPIDVVDKYNKAVPYSKIQYYKENWQILKSLVEANDSVEISSSKRRFVSKKQDRIFFIN